MNVKSKFDTDEPEPPRRDNSQYMRGMCAAPFSMLSGSTRMDVRTVRAPKFIKWIFRTMGWKTDPAPDPHDNR
jgi:hypothetical protein